MQSPVPTVTIALAGAEFGWGSTGKLSSLITTLRDRSPVPLRFVGIASGLSRSLLSAHGIDHWYDAPADDGQAVAEVARREDVRAGLVVLEGPAAVALEAAGVPTVFVDSLPFLWTKGDRDSLPTDVSVYCAQRCVDLPDECREVLASITNLRWVEAVTAVPQGDGSSAPAAGSGRGIPVRRALVSLGGLRSPSLADWTSYPRLVVPAALSALESFGVEEVHVAGNLPAGFSPGAKAPSPMRVSYGPLGHEAFLDRLADTDVLLTSPGLTTLLEAGARATPTVCLPPQNLSQIFNGRFHSRAVGADVRVGWPDQVFAEADVLRDRTTSEEAALRLIYAGIAAAAEEHGTHTRTQVRDGILAALRRARAGAGWTGLVDTVGRGGAAQVADHVLDLVLRAPTAARG
ncbi:hydroxymethylcytosylglucuronate/cytosylglucuronate synthase [Streptomyces yokosukanensis]|uniref:Hydroxymethylcytosylglucuronate/cytosylglucurona te synthase n=1 Tax=Streptomyces yokosukanensis TaxID=67386 RepID=A0A101PDL2_9ACTN|nr:hydroxymethylcytosylglucuronate/cytosylglucuronate synthase [Streptomyces yokosukanensis]KUN09467.1 hydroxymethylcytosylglucuronate/cytosylglucuronate synthase [Streptomyces yokosukanensis]